LLSVTSTLRVFSTQYRVLVHASPPASRAFLLAGIRDLLFHASLRVRHDGLQVPLFQRTVPGKLPRLDTYLGPETPNPVLIRRQRGDCASDTILRDVMGLTKINFNSCLHNDRLPVTIRFADAVGEIMPAAPQTGEPRLPFKFYI
jgi:hypothetical protein